MISIFSPRSSFTIALTRAPFTPTHAPTGSTSGSLLHTASLVREPASRAMLLISTVPSFTSATSDSKRRFTRPGCVLETRIRGPFGVSFTSRIYTLILSVGLKVSPFTCSFSARIASALPRFTLTLCPTTRCTMPVTTSFSLP